MYQLLARVVSLSDDRYLEVCGVLDEVPAAVPLDRRRRMTDHATVEPDHVSLGALDVLEQLRELGRYDVAGYRRRAGVAQFAQRYKLQSTRMRR